MTAPEKTRLITHLRHVDLAVPDLAPSPTSTPTPGA